MKAVRAILELISLLVLAFFVVLSFYYGIKIDFAHLHSIAEYEDNLAAILPWSWLLLPLFLLLYFRLGWICWNMLVSFWGYILIISHLPGVESSINELFRLQMHDHQTLGFVLSAYLLCLAWARGRRILLCITLVTALLWHASFILILRQDIALASMFGLAMFSLLLSWALPFFAGRNSSDDRATHWKRWKKKQLYAEASFKPMHIPPVPMPTRTPIPLPPPPPTQI